jgi:predicted small integral membrane protein
VVGCLGWREIRVRGYRLSTIRAKNKPIENIAWMARTLPSAIFFVLLAATLAVMTRLAIAYPEAERIGILRIPTTRGDRLFVSLIAAAVRRLLWIGFIGTDTLVTLPIGEGLELSSLWLATLISLVFAVAIFRTV